MFSACCRIMVLNVLLPVKYKIANGNSSGVVYKKSTRRIVCEEGIFAITKHLLGPLERTFTMIFCFINSSIKSINDWVDFEVIIMSISPDVSAPRRYDPTTEKFIFPILFTRFCMIPLYSSIS